MSELEDTSTDSPVRSGGLSRASWIRGGILWVIALAALAWLVVGNRGGQRDSRLDALEMGDADVELVETQAGRVAIPKPTVTMTIPEGWQPPLVEGFSLIDQEGNAVTPESLAGQQYVVGFVFTRCQLHCPALVRRMTDLKEKLGDFDGRFLTVTVDPEYDTPEQMAKYAEIYAYDVPADEWKFVTGTPEELLKLIRYGYRQLPSVPPTSEDSIGPEGAHSLALMHVGADGRLQGSYDFRSENDIARLRKVLRGKAETAEENQIRPPLKDMIPVKGSEPSARLTVPQTTYPVMMPAAEAVDTAETVDTAEALETAGPEELDLAARIAEDADPLVGLPLWARRLPAINAGLNGLATLLLVAGYIAIRQRRTTLHGSLMATTVLVSAAFLGCYLTYHWALGEYTSSHGRPFIGTGLARPAYYTILITHVLLAMAVPVLVAIALYRAATRQWEAHARITRWTYPIWLYVSVTGVVIYGMLYHWPVGA